MNPQQLQELLILAAGFCAFMAFVFLVLGVRRAWRGDHDDAGASTVVQSSKAVSVEAFDQFNGRGDFLTWVVASLRADVELEDVAPEVIVITVEGRR